MDEQVFMREQEESPEFKEYRRQLKMQERLTEMMSRPVVVTSWLLGINIVFWVVAKLYGIWLVDEGVVIRGANAEQLVFFSGMKVNGAIEEGQWWRLWSSQYVHLNVMHLMFNGYGIYVLGQFLERAIGARRLLVLYTISGTMGSLASYYLNTSPSGGASGALYGLVGATIVFGWKYRQDLPEGMSRALTRGLMPWVVFGIGIGFLESVPMDNAAHIGGLISGALVGLMMGSALEEGNSKFRAGLLWVALGLVVVALGVTGLSWGAEAIRCLGGPEEFFGCYADMMLAPR